MRELPRHDKVRRPQSQEAVLLHAAQVWHIYSHFFRVSDLGPFVQIRIRFSFLSSVAEQQRLPEQELLPEPPKIGRPGVAAAPLRTLVLRYKESIAITC